MKNENADWHGASARHVSSDLNPTHALEKSNKADIIGSDHFGLELDEVVDTVTQDMQELFAELKAAAADAHWKGQMTDFQVKAQTIRRIFDRFAKSDLSTRRYLRHHLDEEWQSLNSSFDSLRDQFTDDRRKK